MSLRNQPVAVRSLSHQDQRAQTSMLESVAPNVWCREELFRFALLDLPHRMTVVRLSGGALLLHSPVKLTAQLSAELHSIGDVRYIVAPSWWHDSYLTDYATAFPAANLCGTRSVTRAHRNLAFSVVLDEQDGPWEGELEQYRVTGVRLFMNEVEFFHRPTRTLIVADAIHRLRSTASMITRVRYRLVGAYPDCNIPRFYRLAVKDRDVLSSCIDRLLELDVDRLIVCHGDVIEDNPKGCIKRCYRWLYD